MQGRCPWQLLLHVLFLRSASAVQSVVQCGSAEDCQKLQEALAARSVRKHGDGGHSVPALVQSSLDANGFPGLKAAGRTPSVASAERPSPKSFFSLGKDLRGGTKPNRSAAGNAKKLPPPPWLDIEGASETRKLIEEKVATATTTTTGYPVAHIAGSTRLVPMTDTELCLEVVHLSNKSFEELQLHKCLRDDLSSNQDFFVPEGELGRLKWAREASKCLEVQNGENLEGQAIVLGACNESDESQVFSIPLSYSGQIKWGIHPDRCLTLQAEEHGFDDAVWRLVLGTCAVNETGMDEQLFRVPQVLRCTHLPDGEGEPQIRCEGGNELNDGYHYVFNSEQFGEHPACGTDECVCCRRKKAASHSHDHEAVGEETVDGLKLQLQSKDSEIGRLKELAGIVAAKVRTESAKPHPDRWLADGAAGGDRQVKVSGVNELYIGGTIVINPGGENEESRKVVTLSAALGEGYAGLKAPLEHNHTAEEPIKPGPPPTCSSQDGSGLSELYPCLCGGALCGADQRCNASSSFCEVLTTAELQALKAAEEKSDLDRALEREAELEVELQKAKGLEEELEEEKSEGWYDSGEDMSCRDACEAHGLLCVEEAQFVHNSEVDESDEVMAIIARLGGETSAVECSGELGSKPTAPSWTPTTCTTSEPGRLLSSLDCAAVPDPLGHGKHRLCYCISEGNVNRAEMPEQSTSTTAAVAAVEVEAPLAETAEPSSASEQPAPASAESEAEEPEATEPGADAEAGDAAGEAAADAEAADAEAEDAVEPAAAPAEVSLQQVSALGTRLPASAMLQLDTLGAAQLVASRQLQDSQSDGD
eukprot:TRINITY_DN50616_c0_g2_i1.p1 TRINITY_DN50616_c0_g2~~TRINITY_DN50616_c0_g2_i1.p1  ORF type:complete len:819 (+),score=200.33 TRINITY_DN50616_c0_g2_i1:144-2600(+)